jgi:hypothetical protein
MVVYPMKSKNSTSYTEMDGESGRNFGIAVICIFFAICCCYVMIVCLCKVEQEERPLDQCLDTNENERRRQRKDLIRAALTVKPWTEAMSASAAIDETATKKTIDTKETEAVPKPKLRSQHDSLASLYGPCCAICLNGFKMGQLVCESKNGSCEHAFHERCLTKWLLEGHDGCPICRAKYLVETA